MTLDDDGLVERLRELIGQYYDLGYAEGVAGRDADTVAGDAQTAWLEIDDAITRLKAERDGLAKALSELANSDLQLIVREIVAGWNGEGREGGPFIRHPDMLGASIPATCGMVYALDDAFTLARATLSTGAPDGK